MNAVSVSQSHHTRVWVALLCDLIVVVGGLFNAATGLFSLFSPSAFLSMVGQPLADLTSAATVFAAYAGGRELAIGLALIGSRALHQPRLLAGVLLVACLANVVDAGGALATDRWVQLPGAVVFTIAYGFAAMWFAHRGEEPRVSSPR